MRLSPHFTLSEMCKSQLAVRRNLDNLPDTGPVAAMQALCQAILEPVRTHFGVPIIPSSGYRSIALNRALGGSADSQHCKGEAVDFEIAGVAHADIAVWIRENCTFDQLIIEYPQADNVSAGWLHISYVAGRNRNETLSKTRNGFILGFPPFW